MRYRKQSADGDYQFVGTSVFLVDSPETVAQAIKTRLNLVTGDWFLDDRVGFDLNKVTGTGTQGTRDAEVKRVILETRGVRSLVSYFSQVDAARRFTVEATVDTEYGPVTINEVLQ